MTTSTPVPIENWGKIRKRNSCKVYSSPFLLLVFIGTQHTTAQPRFHTGMGLWFMTLNLDWSLIKINNHGLAQKLKDPVQSNKTWHMISLDPNRTYTKLIKLVPVHSGRQCGQFLCIIHIDHFSSICWFIKSGNDSQKILGDMICTSLRMNDGT